MVYNMIMVLNVRFSTSAHESLMLRRRLLLSMSCALTLAFVAWPDVLVRFLHLIIVFFSGGGGTVSGSGPVI
jgi:hypothetical protein